jgi:hypothetical protein
MVMDAHDEQELVFDHVNNALIRSEQMIDYFNTSVVTQILSGSWPSWTNSWSIDVRTFVPALAV